MASRLSVFLVSSALLAGVTVAQTPTRTATRTRAPSPTRSPSTSPVPYGLALVGSVGSTPLVAVTLSVDTRSPSWANGAFTSGQCLWQQNLLTNYSREAQAAAAGFTFGIFTDGPGIVVAVPCNASRSLFLETPTSQSNCRAGAIYICVLPPGIDSLTWRAYATLYDAAADDTLLVEQDGGVVVELPSPSLLSAVHTGYADGPNARGFSVAGLTTLEVNMTRISHGLLADRTLPLLGLLDEHPCRLDQVAAPSSDAPGGASPGPTPSPAAAGSSDDDTANDGDAVVTLSFICDTPPSFWRAQPATLRILGVGPDGNGLAIPVAPNARHQRRFTVDPGDIWTLGSRLQVYASGIAELAPFAVQLIVAEPGASGGSSGGSGGSGGAGGCPPSATCWAVPCINVSLPLDPGAADGADFVLCVFAAVTERLANASVAAIQVFFTNSSAALAAAQPAAGADSQLPPPLPYIPASAANTTSVRLAFDGTPAANEGIIPVIPRPLLAIRYLNIFDQLADWLPRQTGGFVEVIVSSLLWSAADVTAATGGTALGQQLPQLAFRTPAPPLSVRAWLVDRAGHISCRVVRLSINAEDYYSSVLFPAPAGDQAAMRVVVEVAGVVNMTSDGLPGDALLPLPAFGEPTDDRWIARDRGESRFALRYPPGIGSEDKQYIYEPSPDMAASSPARLVDVRARADRQFLIDAAAGRVTSCLIAGSSYPVSVADPDCSDDCSVLCIGVNESAVAEALVPRMAQQGQTLTGVPFGIWWGPLPYVWAPESDRDGGLRFYRRAQLSYTVPSYLVPGVLVTLVGSTLCGDPLCAIQLPPLLSVAAGGVPVQDLQYVSTSVLRFTAPLVPRTTPGWPLVNISFRDARGYAAANDVVVSYPETDGVLIAPAAPLPPYFVPSDADAAVALPSPIVVMAVLDGIPLQGKRMNCSLSSRSSRASLRNMDVDGADVAGRSGPDGTVRFPSVAVLASFSVAQASLLVSCRFDSSPNTALELRIDLPAAPLRVVLCKPPQAAVLSQDAMLPWSLAVVNASASSSFRPGSSIDSGIDTRAACAGPRLPLPADIIASIVCSVRSANASAPSAATGDGAPAAAAAAASALFLQGASAVPKGAFFPDDIPP